MDELLLLLLLLLLLPWFGPERRAGRTVGRAGGAAERGTISEVAHKVGKLATSPLPYRGAPPLQSGGLNQKWPTKWARWLHNLFCALQPFLNSPQNSEYFEDRHIGWNKKNSPCRMPKTKSPAPPAPTKHLVPCDNFGVRRGGGGSPPPPLGSGPDQERPPCQGHKQQSKAPNALQMKVVEKLGTCEVWNGELWCGENSAPILKYYRKIWYKSPDCSTKTSIDRVWWLVFPLGLWLVAVISRRLLDGCLDGWSVGHNGDAHTKRAKNET